MRTLLSCLLSYCLLFYGATVALAETKARHFDFSNMMSNTKEHELSNGFKVVVREDHRAPVIVFQIWYRVGSSDEPVHQTGISHVLEHMMFKGTPTFAPGALSEFIAEQGGEENAFTSRDYTAYYQVWTQDKLPLSLQLEADRMRNLLLDEAEFEKERQVVIEERRQRTEDNPNARAYERFLSVAYSSSSYQQPVVGWMHDLNSLNIEDVRRWYDAWYAPNNATVVVVGNVSAYAVFELAEKYFASLPARILPKRLLVREVDPLGERRLKVKVPAKLPALYLGFNVPSIMTTSNKSEIYALYLLSGILDGGYSARLSSRLVREKKLAARASAGYSPFARGDNLFMFTLTPRPGQAMDVLEQALWDEIKRLHQEPPLIEEIRRIKAQILAQLVFEQDSLSSQATQIGRLESLGLGWKFFPEFLNAIDQVTPEQVQAAAQKYLITDRVTVAELVPLPISNSTVSNRKKSAVLTRH